MSAYQPRSLPCDTDKHIACAVPDCGCSCHPPVIGEDGIAHHEAPADDGLPPTRWIREGHGGTEIGRDGACDPAQSDEQPENAPAPVRDAEGPQIGAEGFATMRPYWHGSQPGGVA